MPENLVCNVCPQPGEFAAAPEVARVPSNVRRFQDEQFTVWRCRHCRSLHSKEEVDLDHYYAGYMVHDNGLDYFSRRIYGGFLRVLRRLGFGPGHSLLDHGCGAAQLLALLQEAGHKDFAGYDPYVEKYADPRVLERQYDAVVSTEVLEHVPEPRKLLADLIRLAKPGGLLMIGTPNAANISLHDAERHQFVLHQPYHRHILSQQALCELGTEVGLAQVHYDSKSWDHLAPAANFRFLSEYVRANGNVLDACYDPPRVGMVLTSPRLLYYAVFGFWCSPKTTQLVVFRKPASANGHA